MLGTHGNLGSGDDPLALVLVRQATGLGTAVLDGSYHGAEFSVDPHSYSLPPSVNVSDFTINASRSTATFTGGSTASVSFDQHHVQRDSLQAGVRVENSTDAFPVNVTVTEQEKLSLRAMEGGVTAAVVPGGTFAVYVTDLSNTNADFSMGFLVKAPPAKN